MKTYTVLYAEDVPNYCTVEIQAETDAKAVVAAKARHNRDLQFEDADWENPILRRIVHILDFNCVAVAQDVPLDGHQLLADSKVRDAVQYALESLLLFKRDRLSTHGLNVALEKLETAYAELGGKS
jgi:hypothetical protein